MSTPDSTVPTFEAPKANIPYGELPIEAPLRGDPWAEEEALMLGSLGRVTVLNERNKREASSDGVAGRVKEVAFRVLHSETTLESSPSSVGGDSALARSLSSLAGTHSALTSPRTDEEEVATLTGGLPKTHVNYDERGLSLDSGHAPSGLSSWERFKQSGKPQSPKSPKVRSPSRLARSHIQRSPPKGGRPKSAAPILYRQQSRLSVEADTPLKRDFTELESTEFQEIMNSMGESTSHYQMCTRMKKAVRFVQEKLKDAPISQARYLQKISDSTMGFLMSLDFHMPKGVKESVDYSESSPFGQVMLKIKAHLNEFASKRLRQAEAFFNLNDQINLAISILKRSEVFQFEKDATLDKVMKDLAVDGLITQHFDKGEKRDMEFEDPSAITIEQLIQIEMNERGAPKGYKEKATALIYPFYKPGELESYRLEAIAQRRGQLDRSGYEPDEIEKILFKTDFVQKAYQIAGEKDHIKKWVQEENISRTKELESWRSDYKMVKLAPNDETIIEFTLDDSLHSHEKYIFSVQYDEETRMEVVMTRLFLDHTQDTELLSPRYRKRHSTASFFSDTSDTTPSPTKLPLSPTEREGAKSAGFFSPTSRRSPDSSDPKRNTSV